MGKPAPNEGRRHANTINSYPWNSKSQHNSMSRSDILLGKVDTAWGSDQSLDIAVNGMGPPFTPQKWPKQGRCLRVPKCVILSTLPNWTLFWEKCYFYGPRDVIGVMLLEPHKIGNYYYFEQWNYPDVGVVDSTAYDQNDPRIPDSAFWSNFDPPVSDEDKALYLKSYQRFANDSPITPTVGPEGVGDPLDPPSPRFSRIVGTIQNVYYSYHRDITNAFRIAKRELESGPDPIYVTIPEWMPPNINQTRNGYLKKSKGKRTADRGTSCHVHDAGDCERPIPLPWGPAYPDVDDPRNSMNFTGGSVPWLTSVDPGFGTNTLHMYVGHSVLSPSSVNDLFTYQAFPLTPEGIYLGPIFLSNYLGATLPYFAGRRPIWRDMGYAYGYTNGGAEALYNLYGGTVQGAADALKGNFWKYRQYATRLFTYPSSNQPNWNIEAISADRQAGCPSTSFYFGHTFAEWQEQNATEDISFMDCAPGSPIALKYSDMIVQSPSAASIREAIKEFYPPIRDRINTYYGGIEAGTEEFFKLAIKRNNLQRYNVSYEGSFGALLDPDAIVTYVRDHFANNP